MPKNPLAPQAGEMQPLLFDEEKKPTKFLNDLPKPVQRFVLAHGSNGFPPIMPDEDGKMPTGAVVCVRDPKGLIAYDADGSGRRLEEANLAAIKGTKPKKPRRSKKGAGAPQSDSKSGPPDSPPPPAPEQSGEQGQP